MDKNATFHDLEKLFREVFNSPELTIEFNTSAKDIHEWDSLNHVLLISKIENHFNLKFELTDIIGFNNVGDILTSINTKLKERNII